ncbi:uncharacterized protein [Spinacia oleracea]|uniref:Uncharacterized protein n=1 Tax=Spinacia oleracea TaxID=3562 RepID=A0ABM3R0C5_SPIOL|nr:uncharacterized protein LOC130463789 [Spinacia oleracea]XP_056689007.1 uncharacterized protein LOC130463789 [Spinacia oleracea]
MGGSSRNPPSSEKFWFDTHKTGNILDKPETVKKHEMIKKTIQENPEMEVFDVIEECFGRQNKGYVAGYGGSVKPKDLRGPLPNRFDLEMKLKQAGKVNEVLLGRIEHVEAENRTFAARLNEVEEKFEGKLQAIDAFGDE